PRGGQRKGVMIPAGNLSRNWRAIGARFESLSYRNYSIFRLRGALTFRAILWAILVRYLARFVTRLVTNEVADTRKPHRPHHRWRIGRLDRDEAARKAAPDSPHDRWSFEGSR